MNTVGNCSNTSERQHQENYGAIFYAVESTQVEIILQCTFVCLICIIVLAQNFFINKLILTVRQLRTPAHLLVVSLLLWDSIMLILFTISVLTILINGGIRLTNMECKLMYFFQRFFRGCQISNYSLLAFEKALFIIFPFHYGRFFSSHLPTVVAISMYLVTTTISLSSFFEPATFLPGPLTCTNSVFTENNAFLLTGIVIRCVFFAACFLCIVAICVFAINFNRKEKLKIRHPSTGLQRELFNGMLRNIVITVILTVCWSLQWAFIVLMNKSEGDILQGRIAAFLYHCFVSMVNPLMVRYCYKPIRLALKNNLGSPLDSESVTEEEMFKNVSLSTFLRDGNTCQQNCTVEIQEKHKNCPITVIS